MQHRDSLISLVDRQEFWLAEVTNWVIDFAVLNLQRVSQKFQGKDHSSGSCLVHVNYETFYIKQRPKFIKFYSL